MITTMLEHLCILAIHACVIAQAPVNQDAAWPSFRGGPLQHGVAPGAVADDLELLWSFETKSAIKSTAAIAGGRVFVGSDDGHLYCLDLSTGKQNWRVAVGQPVQSPPLVFDDRVVFGADDGQVRCVRADTGDPIWSFATGDKVVGGANLAAGPQGGKRVIVGSYDAKLYALDAADGALQWSYETGNYVNGTPAIDRGRAIVGGCDGFVHIVSIADGTAQPPVAIEAYIAGSTAVRDGRAWLGHYGNRFVCIDLNAAKIAWEYGPREFAFFSSPAVIDNRVIFGGRDRRVHCAKASDGTPLWEFRTRGKVDSSPVIAPGSNGERVVVGSEDGRLYMLKLDDGAEVWSYLIGKAIVASPAVADGRIVIGSEDGRVYCFGPPETATDEMPPDQK